MGGRGGDEKGDAGWGRGRIEIGFVGGDGGGKGGKESKET